MVTVRGHEQALFEGEVTAVEHVFGADGGREVRVRAYDLSHRLRKRQQVRGHVHITARGLAEELGGGETVYAGPWFVAIRSHAPGA